MTPSPEVPADYQKYRPAVLMDLARLVALEEGAFDTPWTSAAIEAELQHPEALVLVVEAAGEELAGYLSIRLAPCEADLLRVAVAPEHRRRGLAAGLLEAGLAEAERRGAEVCFLEVRSDNQAAIGLYQRFGFSVVGRRPGYYSDGGEALTMGRPMTPPRP